MILWKIQKKNEDQKHEFSEGINVENTDIDLILQKAEETMKINELMIKELEKGNVPIPDKKDVEFKMLSHATLIQYN